jgi:acetate kinase
MNILVLNAGSSSQKSCLYQFAQPFTTSCSTPLSPLWEGAIDWTHQTGQAAIRIKTAAGRRFTKTVPSLDRKAVIEQFLQLLWHGETQVIAASADIDAIGHRVVHGGQVYREAVRIDATVKTTLEQLTPLAPVHNPVNLEGIEIAEALLGGTVPQFAIFDTAFHSHLPDSAAIYPGPYAWIEQGIRRYGFHGISHEYCAHRTAQLLNQDLESLRLITCHLGNGCSLAAIRAGQSVDTTMGFTPLEGLMMGSRSGSVDPGILLYLMRQQGLNVDQLDRLLNQQSGLLGLSGVSNDMRAVQAAIAQNNSQAQLAYQVYIHRIRSGIGAMLASLGGLEALVFTAGVGEHDAGVRSHVCQGFEFLGLALDESKNSSNPRDQDIAAADSRVRVFVIQTQEDWQIAKTCWAMMT